jgi:hypothetical protein
VLSGSYRTINLDVGQRGPVSDVFKPRVNGAVIVDGCHPFRCAVASIPLCDARMYAVLSFSGLK